MLSQRANRPPLWRRRPDDNLTALRTRRLRLVVLNLESVSDLLRGRNCDDIIDNDRLAESRYLACHEIHVHRRGDASDVNDHSHRNRSDYGEGGGDHYVRIFERRPSMPLSIVVDETSEIVATTAPRRQCSTTTMLLLHKDILRDARYDRAVNAWMRRCSDIFRRRSRRHNAALTTTTALPLTATTAVVLRNGATATKARQRRRRCCCDEVDCSRVLVPYELYDMSGSVVVHSGGRRRNDDGGGSLHESTTPYIVRADIVVIAYDPTDDGSLNRALAVLVAVRSKDKAVVATPTVVVLIENNIRRRGDGEYVNPNSIRSLCNYYRDVEEITLEGTSDVIALNADGSYDDSASGGDGAIARRFFVKMNENRRNNRAIMDLLLTRAISAVIRPDETSSPFASTVAPARLKHVFIWTPAATATTTTTVDDGNDDNNSSSVSVAAKNDDSDERVDNAINELASLDYDDDHGSDGNGGGLRNIWRRRLKSTFVVAKKVNLPPPPQ